MGKIAVMRPSATKDGEMRKSIYGVLGLAVLLGALFALVEGGGALLP